MGDKRYSVKWIGDTVQGEGGRAGARSVFVRLAGCNAWTGRPADRAKGAGACARWCDTDFFKGEPLTAAEVVARASKLWDPRKGARPWAVLSGGEPALQLDTELLNVFRCEGWAVAVETNGSVECPALRDVDWLTVSPKIGLPLAAGVLGRARELKVVLPGVAPGDDVGWSDDGLEFLAAQLTIETTLLYVQPQDPVDPGYVNVSHLHKNLARAGQDAAVHGAQQYERNVRRCLDFVKAHPRWRVSVQAHKLLGVP